MKKEWQDEKSYGDALQGDIDIYTLWIFLPESGEKFRFRMEDRADIQGGSEKRWRLQRRRRNERRFLQKRRDTLQPLPRRQLLQSLPPIRHAIEKSSRFEAPIVFDSIQTIDPSGQE
jgi:hypothetical protein